MKADSIQKRMMRWYAAAATALTAVLAALLLWGLPAAMSAVARQRLQRDGAAVASKVQVDAGSVTMTDVWISPDTLYTVFSADGVPLFANHSRGWFDAAPFEPGSIQARTEDGQEWLLQDGTVDAAGGTAAYVRTGTPAGSSADAMQALAVMLAIAVPLTAAAALLISRRIARSSLTPLQEMARAAQDISSGDLSRRLPAHGSDDEVGRLETALNTMLDSLETSIEREKQFTADASHELRTPLSVILGAAQTSLDNESATAADHAAALRIVYRKGTEMQALLSQMLLLARGDAQTKFMEISTFDLSEVVQDIADESEQAAAARDVAIVTDLQPDLNVSGDLMLITRAVLNLVDNGIKYGRQGGWLRIALQAKDGFAVLRVQDNGEGIRPEHLPHVFDRFYRADSSRSSGGFGLGLALVERIAHLHGGSVSAESELGSGSTFRLILPLAKADTARQSPQR